MYLRMFDFYLQKTENMQVEIALADYERKLLLCRANHRLQIGGSGERGFRSSLVSAVENAETEMGR